MEKKGLSDVIAVLLIILLIFAAIVILWAFIRTLIIREGEISQAKIQILAEKMEVKHAEIDYNSNKAVIMIEKGPVAVRLDRVIEVTTTISTPLDLISVTDVSSSMNYSLRLADFTCFDMKHGFLSWNTPEGFCESVMGGSVFTSPENRKDCFCMLSCSNFKKTNCELTGGEWKSRIDMAKFVNKILIEEILKFDNKRIGLVAYGTANREDYFHELSSNKEMLIQKIESYEVKQSPLENTCICCGIKRAIQEIESHSLRGRRKTVVLLTDDSPNIACSGANAAQDALDEAARLKQKGIMFYVVGLGNSVSESFLQDLANAGGGVYTRGTASEIVEAYRDILKTELQKTYEPIESASYIIVSIIGSSGSTTYNAYNPPKQPYERKIYEVPITPSIGEIKKIEIYPVVITPSGKHVTGNPTSIYEIKSN